MKLLFAVLSWFALVSMAVGSARGDWRDWFGQPRPEAAAQSPDDDIPDQPGAVRSSAPAKSSGPSMLDRFSTSTHRFFSRTRQALTPAPKKKSVAKASRPKDRPFSGWMPNSSRKSTAAAKPSSGFTWFKPKEPEGPSSTLEDFFRQPRP